MLIGPGAGQSDIRHDLKFVQQPYEVGIIIFILFYRRGN